MPRRVRRPSRRSDRRSGKPASRGEDRRPHAVHHRRRRAHLAPGRRRRRGRPGAARDVGGGRPRGRRRRGPAPLCSSASRASRSCTARRASTTTRSRASRRGSVPILRTVTTPASGARRRSSSSSATAGRMLAGELDLALVTSAEALATQRSYKKRGERVPVLSPARGEAAVSLGVGTEPDRGRARGVPGVVDLRGVRQRPPRPARHRPRRLPRRHRGDARADERGRGREPARVVPHAARRGRDRRRPRPTTGWSATRTRNTWSR